MNTLDEKPHPVDQPLSAEARQILEDYRDDLREIVAKLRKKLN